MIKKYRNVFLAAAIATAMAACGGGDNNEDPLSDPSLVDNITGNGTPEAKEKSLRGIAALLGDGLLSVVGSTSSFFDTFAVITDPNTSAGKVLGVKGDSASGIQVGNVSATCTKGGSISLDLQLDLTPSGATTALTPKFEDGLKEFATGVVDVAVGMTFTKCNEPKHTYDNDPTNDIVNPNESQLLDGVMNVKLHSDNEIPGAAANTKDFQLQGSVKMSDYFIKSYEGSTEPTTLPDAVTGDITLSLLTTDIDTNLFEAVLDIGLTTSDKKADGTPNGYTRTAVKAEGELGLTSDFDIDKFNLSIGGSLRNTGTEAPGTYTLFTSMPLIKNGGDGMYPQAGRIGLIDSDTKLTHYATVTDTGFDFEIKKSDGSVTEGKCTWEEVENNDCDI